MNRMKTTAQCRHKATCQPGDTPCLPGFDLGHTVSATQTPPDSKRVGWWVKTSSQQKLDPSGQPAGYRHHLMCGSKRYRSGIGVDAARTFKAQAHWMNMKERPTQLSQSGDGCGEPSETMQNNPDHHQSTAQDPHRAQTM